MAKESVFEQEVAAAERAGLNQAMKTPCIKGQKPAVLGWLEAHPEHDNPIVRAFIVSGFIEREGKRLRLSEEDYFAGVLG